MKIVHPELRILAAMSQSLEGDYQGQDRDWVGSPFAWIKTRPSRQVGAIGERLVAGWLAARGFNVSRTGDSEADRIIEGQRVEVKFSTLWENGSYKFQQLRDQRYDLVICLGISPFDAHCWVIPKSDIMRLWRLENRITSQHGGRDGEDTAWISVFPGKPPDWIQEYGGTLAQAVSILSRITGFQTPPL